MKNPIYNELLKLKLIKKSRLFILNPRTRDKKIKVIKDSKSKIIFLEKYTTNKNYYYSSKTINKSKDYFFNFKVKKKIQEDDSRRANQFSKFLENRDVLDFGCGYGGFLSNLKNCKSLNGIELNKICINYIKRNLKQINISDNINFFQKKFDIITMYHVLEHIPHQVKTLIMLKEKLKYNGKIIIEVPHAEDFLILRNELKEFKNFTLWSEHLILHTYKSLKTILKKSGFKKINIQYYQRYKLSNHLYWFLKRKPGGHIFFKNLTNKKLDQEYCKNLIRLRQTDTLIAVAQ